MNISQNPALQTCVWCTAVGGVGITGHVYEGLRDVTVSIVNQDCRWFGHPADLKDKGGPERVTLSVIQFHGVEQCSHDHVPDFNLYACEKAAS